MNGHIYEPDTLNTLNHEKADENWLELNIFFFPKEKGMLTQGY